MKTNNQKQDNKGFSLVELIVVIAIMAVLVAVLAPQFTKYIDRSRQSNDATTVAGIVTAAEVGIADSTDYKNIIPGTYTITVGENGTSVTVTPATAGENTTDAHDAMEKAIRDSCGDLKDLKRTANAWGEDIIITVTYEKEGAVTVTYMPVDFANYINKTATTPAANPSDVD